MKRRAFFGWLGASVATPLAAKAVNTAHDMSLPVEPVAVKPQPLPPSARWNDQFVTMCCSSGAPVQAWDDATQGLWVEEGEL